MSVNKERIESRGPDDVCVCISFLFFLLSVSVSRWALSAHLIDARTPGVRDQLTRPTGTPFSLRVNLEVFFFPVKIFLKVNKYQTRVGKIYTINFDLKYSCIPEFIPKNLEPIRT